MFEKILVVDDNIEVRERFYEILSSLGYGVTCVPTGREALLRLTEEKFELIILDEAMPDLTGIETAKKIREFDKDTKIIILSEKEESLPFQLNIQAVIKKDFSNHLMIKNILQVLKEKEIVKKEEPSLKMHKAKVLIVDDNPQIRDLLWSFLDKKGYRVILSSSGEEALMKVKEKKPKVVFLDIRMPGMDGLMVLRKIKGIDPSIQVVMLTSAQEEYMVKEARKFGASDYLTKPCNLKEVETVLLSLLISRENES